MTDRPEAAFDTAIAWLRTNEGDAGESDRCKAVADWLETQDNERFIRQQARQFGLPVAAVRERLARIGDGPVSVSLAGLEET